MDFEDNEDGYGVRDLSKYKKTFLGECCGVGLCQRDKKDKHVMIELLIEDDGQWFAPFTEVSSVWLPDLKQVLDEAEHWMKKYCIKDKEEGGGYKFK